MIVGNLCTQRVSITARDAPIHDLVVRMRGEHVGDLVVVDTADGKTRPVGVITDRDLVVGVFALDYDKLSTLTAGDLLTRPVVTALRDEDSLIVARRMRKHGVRRVPVVDEHGELIGVVGVDDLIGGLHAELHEITHLLSHQADLESALRP